MWAADGLLKKKYPDSQKKLTIWNDYMKENSAPGQSLEPDSSTQFHLQMFLIILLKNWTFEKKTFSPTSWKPYRPHRSSPSFIPDSKPESLKWPDFGGFSIWFASFLQIIHLCSKALKLKSSHKHCYAIILHRLFNKWFWIVHCTNKKKPNS